jgi:[ribosomal protein S18]-alanine N-acetyltransferase
VAISGETVAGFLVLRRVAPDECEILNFAVAREFRRKHIAEGLFRAALRGFRGAVFLEVRASNSVAQEFYKYLGFKPVTIRNSYYHSPEEAGIVMKFHSC